MNGALDPGRIETALRVGLRARGGLAGDWTGKVLVRARTESTNDDAFREGLGGASDGTAVFAEEQQAGRGRGKGRWSAPARRNLTFSVVVRPALSPDRWPRMAHAAALAVARAVDPWLAPLRTEIKWPNDIYADGRKLAGILVEAYPRKVSPFLVVGIGLNVNSAPEEFQADGLEWAVASLASLNGGREVGRSEVAGAVLAELWGQVKRCETEFCDILSELRGRSWVLGKRVRIWMGEEDCQGDAVDLGPNGELLVREEGTGRMREIVTADLVRVIPF